jgi:hypothetical protein
MKTEPGQKPAAPNSVVELHRNKSRFVIWVAASFIPLYLIRLFLRHGESLPKWESIVLMVVAFGIALGADLIRVRGDKRG